MDDKLFVVGRFVVGVRLVDGREVGFEDGVELRVFHARHADVGREVRVEHFGELLLVDFVVEGLGGGVDGEPVEERLDQLALVQVQVVVLDQALQVDEGDLLEVDVRRGHEQVRRVVQHLVLAEVLQQFFFLHLGCVLNFANVTVIHNAHALLSDVSLQIFYF